MSMRFLLCFDKFKDNMSAHTAISVCEKVLLEKGVQASNIATAALTDGGEGFAKILTESAGGQCLSFKTTDARMRPVEAGFGIVELENLPSTVRLQLDLGDQGRLGIVEMAQASGLQELPKDLRDCRKTTTLGTGKIIAELVAKHQVDGLLIGLGGSATNDLGLGVLQALGLNFLDQQGSPLHPFTPEKWSELHRIEGQLPKNFPKIRIACDVQNPLFGPSGAAAVYGPQKGLKTEDLPRIEKDGSSVAQAVLTHLKSDTALPSVPGMGAAGGFAFGLTAAYGSVLLTGFELVSQWLKLDEKLENADWLLTGEGKVDPSSLHGKGPVALAQQALNAGKRVSLLAGCIELEPTDFPPNAKLDLRPISPPDMPLKVALSQGPQNIETTLRELLQTEFA